MAVECEHDHDGYASGYQDALDYVFEYVEHLAMKAGSRRLVADAEGLKLSAQWYGGSVFAFKLLAGWLQDKEEDDHGTFNLPTGG